MELLNPSRVGHQINRELEMAKDRLEAIGPAVSIYGSARIKPHDPYYQAARTLAQTLATEGFTVISGGGPGIMEAANKGAQEGAHGRSVGLNILLPFEQQPNPYQDISLDFVHFAARKVAFCKYSLAFVVMPGGVGTLDELFEVLTLIQTQKMPEIPVLLYGTSFWQGLVEWVRGELLSRQLLGLEDVNRMVLVDSAEEVMKVVRARLNGPK